MLIKEGKRRKRRMQMDYFDLFEAGRRFNEMRRRWATWMIIPLSKWLFKGVTTHLKLISHLLTGTILQVGAGFKHFLLSPLPGEVIEFD